jgi:hypothetical protein
MKDLATANFDKMTAAEFEEYLPELFAMGGGKLSENPRLEPFFAANPTCLALVNDLESIADAAGKLFEPEGDGEGLAPSDEVWSKISSKLKDAPPDGDEG